MDRYALAVGHEQWARIAHSERSRAVLTRLAMAEPSIDDLHISDLGAIVDRAGRDEVAATCTGQEHVQPSVHPILSAAVRHFDLDPLVGLMLVRVMEAGLLGIGRRMRWGAGGAWTGRGEFEADLVSATWRFLHSHAGETLEYPCRTILDQVARSLRTDRDRHKREMSRCGPLLENTGAPSTRGGDDLTALASALALVSGSLIDRRDAALIFRNRVLGYRLSEISAHSGESIAQLSYRRRRAEAAFDR